MNKFYLNMLENGKVSFTVGGQWGSCGKGCAAAYIGFSMSTQGRGFDYHVSGASAQAGHTSIHRGKKRVVFHLPTAPLIGQDEGIDDYTIYLTSGACIDPTVLENELNENQPKGNFFIHPMAAVITDECREAEGTIDSSTTKIASTRKGVGEALSRKIMRKGMVAKDHPYLKQFVKRVDLNSKLAAGKSMLMEVPQGVSLSLNHSPFYPHTTSRDWLPVTSMAEAGIHPSFMGKTMVVLRTFPIRVGNIIEGNNTYSSGGYYDDQTETSWTELGVEPEITTVTKRVRRVFTFSEQQVYDTFRLVRPEVVFLTFVNYLRDDVKLLKKITDAIRNAATKVGIEPPYIIRQYGPTTNDVQEP